jgi:hypothetical protein
MVTTTAMVLAASLLAGDIASEKAFRAWGHYSVGGVWSTTDSQGNKQEARHEWILDKAFLQLTWKGGDDSLHEIHGIDPATGRWTCWGFDNKGRVWKGGVESEKSGEWTFHSSGQGKAGPKSWKCRIIKLGADKVRLEVLEDVTDGKTLPPEVQIWTRNKQPARPADDSAKDTKDKLKAGPDYGVVERMVGRWDLTGVVYPKDPKAAPLKGEDTQETNFLGNSSWLVSKTKGRIGELPLESVGLMCYDPEKGKYTATGAGTLDPPRLVIAEGTYAESSKTMSWKELEVIEPGTTEKAVSKSEHTFKDADTFVAAAYIKLRARRNSSGFSRSRPNTAKDPEVQLQTREKETGRSRSASGR